MQKEYKLITKYNENSPSLNELITNYLVYIVNEEYNKWKKNIK